MNTRSLIRLRPVLRHAGVAACLGLVLVTRQGAAQTLLPDSFFADRPAFSHPEQPAKPASCESIAAQLPDSIPSDSRVDMAIAGTVSLVRTDGALWYVAVCVGPGVRVLCVTYGAGELKPGDKAVLRGGYNRQDKRHVLLDPCLASPESGEGAGEP
ncbi:MULTISPECIES: hypothetical protein [Bosea]|uniref:hypothetical protein n=1 Tax=Bosea TaxID=85413 RepID=UPI00214FD3F8|nr:MULTISPECIES: hypothetical protein [Bosea]MCR4520611.1 hypothetical protein [Bosea sp. 47.2.35]MDR6828448.1 hypothetical protein [Bosea robiniae]MDR6895107.1 hypothetical protein [Bosea sp. BE109]MDR7138327.1 hypothetical protein [Bosea sp. BE168]MDR7175026.1 hypothetical protein [Bosea sp. BE271]